ncbi:MAG: DUF935 family protein [Sulfurovaceae bacterium]|nr:DUF935 family protein [Sulfurovaceae bacterium]
MINPFKKLFSAKTEKRTIINTAVLKSNMLAMARNLDVLEDWLDLDEISSIDADATVVSSVAIRQSASLKKEIVVNCDDENIKKELTNIFSFSFRQQALDVPLQGIGIFELIWKDKEGIYYPKPIERNYQNFKFKDGELWFIPDDIPVPNHKAVYELFRPKFNKPMGRPLYKTLFWLVKFKNASVDFWVDFMERFSSPWVIGTTDGDKDEMAKNLYAMLAGDVAVVEQEDKVELKTPTASGAFGELCKYADDQIRESLLGGNLTGNVEAGSHAAAQTHNDIREDISMSDYYILDSLTQQILEAFITVNNYSKPITVAYKDKDDLGATRAERDLKISQMSGLKPTQDYLESTYSIQLEPKEQEAQTIANKDKLFKAIALTKKITNDDIDQALEDIDTEDIEDEMLDQLLEIFEDCNTFEEAQEALIKKYPNIKLDNLASTLTSLGANATLKGMANIGNEKGTK